jgi:hypothetical protein
LLDKYQINLTDLELETEGVALVSGEAHVGRKLDIQQFIVGAIGRFTDCKVWSSWTNVADEGETPYHERRWVFLGLESDGDFASWLMIHLEDFIWAKADDWACSEAVRQGWLEKKAFALGCAARISERLNEQARKRQQEDVAKLGDGRSLVVVKNAMVETEFRALNLRLVSGRRTSMRMGSGDAYNAGRKAGDSAGFGRPVSSSGPKLLS